ncbi:hypothetical protein [Duganella sp. BJB475]|uniref:hypothetical protein n=1 Tax=Duganella sp. BJB475 TaxID=2233914 RepID=UPI000E3467E2|nr:hypothetical protein [Duganella sp. BJB475]RFP19154.1 hypothetical protein D0T23_05070 [Duganella sp. BJB475]
MKLQKQLILDHNPEQGRHGDCYRTCIAILLGVDAADVPNFTGDAVEAGLGQDAADLAAQAWLTERGYRAIQMTVSAEFSGIGKWIEKAAAGMPYILAGQSPRYSSCHCVIARGALEPVWCPSEGRPVMLEAWRDPASEAHFYFIEFIVRPVAAEAMP